jgi:NADP-dependent 3-hydroxy acid dehydrogenase YdfG
MWTDRCHDQQRRRDATGTARAGAVATELPESTSEPDIAERVRKVYETAIPADSFARTVIFAMSQPDDVDINEILFRPTRQEY